MSDALPLDVAPAADIGDLGPDKPGWHDYTAGPNLVCPAHLNCTKEEIVDQLARFSVPGRDPGSPVADGYVSLVRYPWNDWPAGFVTTTVENDGLTIVNQTTPYHIFFNGLIVRTASMEAGSWYVTTHGFGNNVILGMSDLNQAQGPLIFNLLDRRMRDSIERRRAKGSLDRLDIRRGARRPGGAAGLGDLSHVV